MKQLAGERNLIKYSEVRADDCIKERIEVTINLLDKVSDD